MRLPPLWKTIVTALLFTGIPLGLHWRALRKAAARHGSMARTAGEALNPDSSKPDSLPLSPERARSLLSELWNSCVPWTVDDVLQSERAPVPATFAILDTLTPAETVTLLETGETEPDEGRRNTLRKLLFRNCAAAEPERALNVARTWPPRFADALISPVLSAWRRQSPDANVWFATVSAANPGAWDLCEEKSLQILPPKPPPPPPPPVSLEDAWNQMEKLSEKAVNDSVSNFGPMVAWAESSGQWEEALDKLNPLPEPQRKWGRGDLLTNWAIRDWRAWMQWENAHPERRHPEDPNIADGFRVTLRNCASDFNFQLRSEKGVNTEELTEFMNQSLTSLTGLNSIEEPERTWLGLLESWIKSDSTSASAWLDRQPAGPLRDKAARTVAETVSVEEPEAAFAWADSIKDTALRDSTLVSCWQKWRALEPGPADTWVDGHFPEVRSLAAKAASNSTSQ